MTPEQRLRLDASDAIATARKRWGIASSKHAAKKCGMSHHRMVALQRGSAPTQAEARAIISGLRMSEREARLLMAVAGDE